MIKELTATEARQQTIENLSRNVVFEAIECESKLGLFEFKIEKHFVDDSTIEYLKDNGYAINETQSRGSNFIRNYYRISWIKKFNHEK